MNNERTITIFRKSLGDLILRLPAPSLLRAYPSNMIMEVLLNISEVMK